MRRLSNDIRGGNFHEVEMIQYRTRQYLVDVVVFLKYFVLAICNALQYRFEDNHIMTTFKVLGPTNIPLK